MYQLLDNSYNGADIEFLGDSYCDVSLNITKPLNIYSNCKTVLNAKEGDVAMKISAKDVNIANFVILGNSFWHLDPSNVHKNFSISL